MSWPIGVHLFFVIVLVKSHVVRRCRVFVLLVKKIVLQRSIDESVDCGRLHCCIVPGLVIDVYVYTGTDCFLICHGYLYSDFILS